MKVYTLTWALACAALWTFTFGLVYGFLSAVAS